METLQFVRESVKKNRRSREAGHEVCATRASQKMEIRSRFEIEIGGRVVRLGERTVTIGVLNVTPDSFSDGGRYLNPAKAIRHGLELARAGADWIDVGGESTRPGAKPVSAEEELRRVLPVICALRGRLAGTPIAIDTTKSEVAEAAIGAGATVVNDVSGLRLDPRIATVASRTGVPLVLMHMRGRPATMQQKPFARSVWRSVIRGLAWSVRRALALGVRREQLILDPGLGFGKSRRQNYEILAGLGRLRRFHLPILIGASRKSFVQAIVAEEGLDPRPDKLAGRWPLTATRKGKARLPAFPWGSRDGSTALDLGDAAAAVAAVLAGAHLVRVHHVASVVPALRVADAILAAAR